jgi:hypothetical protein
MRRGHQLRKKNPLTFIYRRKVQNTSFPDKIKQANKILSKTTFLERQTIEEYNWDIDEALKEFEQGYFISSEELRER